MTSSQVHVKEFNPVSLFDKPTHGLSEHNLGSETFCSKGRLKV